MKNSNRNSNGALFVLLVLLIVVAIYGLSPLYKSYMLEQKFSNEVPAIPWLLNEEMIMISSSPFEIKKTNGTLECVSYKIRYEGEMLYIIRCKVEQEYENLIQWEWPSQPN
ncbi:MAG: hypothetical protein AB9915_02485 [Candidatus Dojkabacteria bacterium]